MGRGRKPTPKKLKDLRGNPGKRAINHDEPEVEEGIPDPPEGLSEKAQYQWSRIVPILQRMGVLFITDFIALALLCDALADWFEAVDFLQGSSNVIADGDSLKVNPYYRVKTDAEARIRSWASEFGLTPASRTKIVVSKASNGVGKSKYFPT